MHPTFTLKKTAKIKREEMKNINAGLTGQYEPSLQTISNILSYSKTLSIRKAGSHAPMQHYEVVLN